MARTMKRYIIPVSDTAARKVRRWLVGRVAAVRMRTAPFFSAEAAAYKRQVLALRQENLLLRRERDNYAARWKKNLELIREMSGGW